MSNYETYPLWNPRLPYPSENEMPFPQGMGHILAHDGRVDILPFLHDVSIAAFEGRIYLAWYNSTDAEIWGSSLIRGRSSADGGNSWSEPYTVAGRIDSSEEHFVPVNLFPRRGVLHATVTEMAGKNMTTGLHLFTRGAGDNDWTFTARIGEGFICNTVPQLMDNGNYLSPAWMPMKQETPAFPAALISQGDDIAKPWRCRFFYDPLHPQAVRIRCPETTFSLKGPQITAYVRNDEGPSYVFQSNDYAETWKGPYINPMTVGNSKLFAGKLKDGRNYLIYNADRGYFIRTLLVMAVSDPGEGQYSRVYKIFEDDSADLGRGSIWFYPTACEEEGFLYVGCTLQEPGNIRSAVAAKIPTSSL
ncbi:MAG: exo-alpha-sialidase [Treponema sp.]|nr:exo-alpha-sialidase [Treponema sp.]